MEFYLPHLIYVWSNYLLSTYYVPGTILSFRETALMEYMFMQGETDSK
jgi:hypothetical protein